jgi:hypothetical protein
MRPPPVAVPIVRNLPMIAKSLAVAATAAALLAPAFAATDGVSYPEGFRLDTHVKSMIIEEGHPLFGAVGGLHHLYGNRKAMAGYAAIEAGGSFKDGAVITFDLLQDVRGGNAIVEGARKAVVVMEKDTKRYGDTGGWGFQVFDPVTKAPLLDKAAQQGCFACHQGAAGSDFVFSRFRP